MGETENHDMNKSKKSKIRNCPQPILNAVPPECQILDFTELKTGGNYENKAIIGQISIVYPLGKRATGFIRKLVITDGCIGPEEIPMKLTVFLLNQFAEDSSMAEVESYIIIVNFFVENSTHHKENELSLQILVKNEESQVWFGRKVPPKPSQPCNGKKSSKDKGRVEDDIDHATSTRKRKKTQADLEEPVILQNHYDYVKLDELVETDPKAGFNIYGIAEKCDLKIIQGKRTQILDLILTDETETGFICSIFAAKDETFPDIYPGDIVRVHRMQVYKFRGRLKGKCLSSKFILVFSKSNQGSKPRTNAKSFTFTDEDEEKVKSLFMWYNKKSEPKFISELMRDDFANIICQVIGVYVAKTPDVVVLKVWDGTKTNQLEGTHLGLKTEKLDERLFLIGRHYYVNLSVYGQYATSAVELNPGDYIEVRDAHLYCPKTNPDDCKLCLHTGNKEDRGIRVLPPDDDRVAGLKERLDKVAVDASANNTMEDLLDQNNSIFLNIDISDLASSQKPNADEEEHLSDADVEALNRPLISNEENIPEIQNSDIEALNNPLVPKDGIEAEAQNEIRSVLEAAVRPGQSTQEFSEQMQKDYQNVDDSQDGVSSTLDPSVNKTPMEFKAFLHNPPSQMSPSFFPLSSDSEDEWWTSVPTVSVTEDHSDVKPSSLSEILDRAAPYKFRTLCAVLSYKPNSLRPFDFIHLICPRCLYMTKDAQPTIAPFEERDGLFYFYCPECSKSEADRRVLEYTFLVALQLHDGTEASNLEVLLWRESAVKFFKGISPEQVLQDREAATAVLQMLWNICPNCKPFDPVQSESQGSYSAYPILDCCVLKYQNAGATFYHLFDTRLI